MSEQLVKFIITLKGNEINKFAFSKGKRVSIILGKNKSKVDFAVESNYVSGTHLELIKDENDNLFVKDLDSTNGTYVNNKRITSGQLVSIKINDIISFTEGSDIQLLVLPPSFGSQKSENNPTNNFVNSENNYANNKIKSSGNFSQKTEIVIGRNADCDFIIDNQIVSRRHAIIFKDSDGLYTIKDNNSSNGTYINNSLLTGSRKISNSDKITIGKQTFTLSDLMGGKAQNLANQTPDNSTSLAQLLSNKNTLLIGRAQTADVVINDNLVSRQHTRITKENGKYFVQDLGSTNGTFLNENRIQQKVELKVGDELRIGLKVFSLEQAEKALSDTTAIRAINVTKKFSNGYVGLKPMSVNIPSRAFIALMGPSGCGKTTLMNTLNGDNPATGGSVHIHGLELTKNYSMLKQKIGYVPQDDIVHRDLTVESSLYYAAKLRMNPDTTDQEITQRIDEVLTSLKINRTDIRTKPVGKLSGGQRKRVSIAVELLNKPTILFLDEPTSPLDPETIDGFLTSIKELTELEETTVIMVTHKPSDLNYVDRVIFLGTEGYQAFYGSENDLYNHFDIKDRNIIGIYSLLSTKEKANEWGEKWKIKSQTTTQELKEEKGFAQKPEKVSWFSQLFWLTKRYANIKLNDKGNMALLMLQPIIIPLALIYLFDKLQLGVLFMMAISAIWFGVSNAAKEIVSEIPIYKRERMFNLNITTYMLSKILVLSVIALIQVTIFLQIVQLRFLSDEIHIVNMFQATFFLFLLSFSATLLGLLLSVIFDNAEKVMTFIPIILIPQIIFSGVIADIDSKDKELFSYTMFGRWGTEGLARIQSDYTGYKHIKSDTLLIKISEKQDTIPTIDTIMPNGMTILKDKIISIPEFKDSIQSETLIKSVYNSVPEVIIFSDTLLITNDGKDENTQNDTIPYKKTGDAKFKGADPLKNLKFYENAELLNKFDSLEKNILAISLIDLLLLISIYVILKRKDTI